jgi:hypothetical protein
MSASALCFKDRDNGATVANKRATMSRRADKACKNSRGLSRSRQARRKPLLQAATPSRPSELANDADILRVPRSAGDERLDLYRDLQNRDEAVEEVAKGRL